MSKILFVPWRQIESIEHYAARRDLPKIKNSLGEWTVDYKNVQDHRAWSKMLKPLKDGLSRASARRKLIIPKVPKELLAEWEKKLAKLKPF
jgi:hypothetical protein